MLIHAWYVNNKIFFLWLCRRNIVQFRSCSCIQLLLKRYLFRRLVSQFVSSVVSFCVACMTPYLFRKTSFSSLSCISCVQWLLQYLDFQLLGAFLFWHSLIYFPVTKFSTFLPFLIYFQKRFYYRRLFIFVTVDSWKQTLILLHYCFFLQWATFFSCHCSPQNNIFSHTWNQ